MIGEGIGLAAERAAEAAIRASEVADLGAIKPLGFGSLIKERFPSVAARPRMDGLYASELPRLDLGPDPLGPRVVRENPYFSIRYRDVSRECAEYLCDYGITPRAWQEAASGRRMDMLGRAAEIFGRELQLPEDWINGVRPAAAPGEDYLARASCTVRPRSDGGVAIEGIPALHVNPDSLPEDYWEAMAATYHEMIHMKQYAAVDRLAPGQTADTRLLDLIRDLKTNGGTPEHRASHLRSPYEAEAWAQESYFKKTLEAVVRDRYA